MVKEDLVGQYIIKLRLPTDCRISSRYKEIGKHWNWHFSDQKNMWINSKYCQTCGIDKECKCKNPDLVSQHKGIDFACPVGSVIKGMMDGTILKCGWEDDKRPPNDKGFGLRIIQEIEQDDRKWLLYYGHLSELMVTKGDQIKSGQIIAKSGHTGHSTGAHLHIEVRDINTQQQHPIEFV